MQIYPNCFIFFDHQLAAENVTIETGIEGDDQMALSTKDGFKGITPSARTRVVRATFLVPPGGFEYPYEQKFRDSEVVVCEVQCGQKVMQAEGFFMSAVSVSAGIGRNTEVSIEWRGEPKIFESLV